MIRRCCAVVFLVIFSKGIVLAIKAIKVYFTKKEKKKMDSAISTKLHKNSGPLLWRHVNCPFSKLLLTRRTCISSILVYPCKANNMPLNPIS
jgi:hypothetical protein